MDRRAVLMLLLGGGGFAAAAGFLWSEDPSDAADQHPLDDDDTVFEAAKAIGVSWLALQEPRPSPELLRQRVLGDTPPVGIHQIRRRIRRSIRRDFSMGRTVIVEGWVISETEAALCGWASQL